MKIDNEKLEILMGKRCISGCVLSVKAGISSSTMYKVLAGDEVSSRIVGEIAEALNVGIWDLIETKRFLFLADVPTSELLKEIERRCK